MGLFLFIPQWAKSSKRQSEGRSTFLLTRHSKYSAILSKIDFAHWDIVYNDRIIDRNNRYNDRKPKSEPRDLKKLFLTTSVLL